jgi:hypothetical protein
VRKTRAIIGDSIDSVRISVPALEESLQGWVRLGAFTDFKPTSGFGSNYLTRVWDTGFGNFLTPGVDEE